MGVALGRGAAPPACPPPASVGYGVGSHTAATSAAGPLARTHASPSATTAASWLPPHDGTAAWWYVPTVPCGCLRTPAMDKTPGAKVLAKRATGWPWLACNDKAAPAPCVARVEAQVAQGNLSPSEGVRRLRAALGASQRRCLEYLKAVHDLGEGEAEDVPLADPFAEKDVRERQACLRAVQRGNRLAAKLHLCRGAFAEAGALEEAVRSMRARYGVPATPTISFGDAP